MSALRLNPRLAQHSLRRHVALRSSARGPPRLLRPLSSSAARAGLKESDRDKDDLHEEVDAHKHDGLRKQKEGKGHWKPELASDSETAIKADRDEHGTHEEHIQHLQRETAARAESDQGKK